jgi:hypothetical protein
MSVDRLYKYGRLGEHSESLFSRPEIWFSSPAALNDPFECRPWYNFEGTKEQVLEVFERIIRRHHAHWTQESVSTEAMNWYSGGRHQDPRFWTQFRRDLVNMIKARIGLCCLTRTNTNILMWSHYASEHQGYCLEFAASSTTPFFGEAQKVHYSEQFPVVNFFNTPNDTQVDLMFLTKFSGWKYEEEYRIVDHQFGAGLHAYPVELLKSVTFGFRTPEADRAKIRDWLRKRNAEVKLYQAAIDDREFKIVICPV